MTILDPIPPLSALPLEHLAHLSADDLAALVAWREQVNGSLMKWPVWQKQQPMFCTWLHTALKLLELHLIAHGHVPAWEVLLDARYGSYPQKEADWFDNHAYHALIEPLRGLPVEWLERVLEVALALLDARYGPLVRTYTSAGGVPANADETRIVRKAVLHATHPSDLDRCAVPRAFRRIGEWPWTSRDDYPWQWIPPWEIWRVEMARTARLFGLPHPDDESRIREWLIEIPIRPKRDN